MTKLRNPLLWVWIGSAIAFTAAIALIINEINECSL